MTERRPLPHWPGAMNRRTAASYCDMTPAQFEREVAENRMPLPTMTAAGERWLKVAIDAALWSLNGGPNGDGGSSGGGADWRQSANLYAQG